MEIDTGGLDTGRWPLSLSFAIPSTGISALTSYVEIDGTEIPIQLWGLGMIEVPEPGLSSFLAGCGVAAWALLRSQRPDASAKAPPHARP